MNFEKFVIVKSLNFLSIDVMRMRSGFDWVHVMWVMREWVEWEDEMRVSVVCGGVDDTWDEY